MKKCEDKIASLELKLKELDTMLSDPALGTEVAKLQALTIEQAQVTSELEALYSQWETLAQ